MRHDVELDLREDQQLWLAGLVEGVIARYQAEIRFPQGNPPVDLRKFYLAIASLVLDHAKRGGLLDTGSVLQDWVVKLPMMQQSVLLTSLRGPDTLPKDHVSKLLLRWLRRSVLKAAFGHQVLGMPYDDNNMARGGSFTGASLARSHNHVPAVSPGVTFWCLPHTRSTKGTTPAYPSWQDAMHALLSDYLRAVDETPHHFQLHFMHAAEVLGYQHPHIKIRDWWNEAYRRLVNDMHLNIETRDVMMKRLGDVEDDWRAAEEVVAWTRVNQDRD